MAHSGKAHHQWMSAAHACVAWMSFNLHASFTSLPNSKVLWYEVDDGLVHIWCGRVSVSNRAINCKIYLSIVPVYAVSILYINHAQYEF